MPAAARPIIHPRKRQETQKKGTEDRIEPGQRVTSDDLPAGARRCVAGDVDLAGCDPVGDLRGAEAVIRAGSVIWNRGGALGVGHKSSPEMYPSNDRTMLEPGFSIVRFGRN